MRVALVLLVAALAVAAAGCGGSSNSPSIASLGTTTSQSSSTKPIVPKGGSFVKFVNCMRAHGVDANVKSAGNGVQVQVAGKPMGGSQMTTAQNACRKYLPGGGPKPMTPQQKAQFLKRMVKLAKCMRAHGVANFPDPSADGTLNLNKQVLDPGSPIFEASAKACGAGGPNGKGFAIRIGP